MLLMFENGNIFFHCVSKTVLKKSTMNCKSLIQFTCGIRVNPELGMLAWHFRLFECWLRRESKWLERNKTKQNDLNLIWEDTDYQLEKKKEKLQSWGNWLFFIKGLSGMLWKLKGFISYGCLVLCDVFLIFLTTSSMGSSEPVIILLYVTTLPHQWPQNKGF